jgi:hypothetical protein
VDHGQLPRHVGIELLRPHIPSRYIPGKEPVFI